MKTSAPRLVEPLLVLGVMSVVALLILISVDGMLADLMSGPPAVLSASARSGP